MTIQKQNRIIAEYLLNEIRTFLFEEKSISEEVNKQEIFLPIGFGFSF